MSFWPNPRLAVTTLQVVAVELARGSERWNEARALEGAPQRVDGRFADWHHFHRVELLTGAEVNRYYDHIHNGDYYRTEVCPSGLYRFVRSGS